MAFEIMSADHESFEVLYKRYNLPQLIHPDPLELVTPYKKTKDREVAGLICASLAMGRVAGILKACREVLTAVPNPFRDVTTLSEGILRRRLDGFVYRFYREQHIVRFLAGLGCVIRRFGSLEGAFLAGTRQPHCGLSVDDGLSRLVTELRDACGDVPEILLPLPSRGSACKRLHLYLRWMVRQDAVDPGGWYEVSPRILHVPVDTHMLQVARHFGITSRKQADAKTSQEITDYFRTLEPSDPVKYDFVLTRAGISGREDIRRAVYS